LSLQRDVDEHRHHDREREGRAELRGELCRLGDEARTYGARRHQEHGAEQAAILPRQAQTPARNFFTSAVLPQRW